MIALTPRHFSAYCQLMRIDRPIGSYLLAWPALWALWLAAEGPPRLSLLLVFLCGTFLMRSAGCVINDFADRQIDGHVARSAQRPLVTAAVSEREALQLFILLCSLAASLLLWTNWLTAQLALVALALTTVYPFCKRFTRLPQLVLGMAFSFSVPMAFAAQSGEVPAVAWRLYAAVVTWVVAYDTFYAMVDRDDDIKIGVKSSAILFGRYDRAITATLQLLFITQMLSIGQRLSLGPAYTWALGAAAALLCYQQWLIAKRDKERCFAAFINNHRVGMVIFIGLALHYAITASY